MAENEIKNDASDKAAQETAQHLEQAVKSGDEVAYQGALKEVDDYRKTHSDADTQAYVGAITKQLEQDKVLPSVVLFEAKADFSKMDIDGNGELSKGEINAFRANREVNDLQQNLLDQALTNKDKISSKHDDWGWDEGISKNDLDAGLKTEKEAAERRENLNHTFGNGSESSLYDRIKDKNGNVCADQMKQLQDLDKKLPNAQILTNQDRDSLKFLQSKVKDGIIKKEDLRTICTENGLDFEKLAPKEAEQRLKASRALFEKGEGGKPSLYEQLKDSNGNISKESIQQYIDTDKANPASLNLSDDQRASLQYMNSLLESSGKDKLTADELTAEKGKVQAEEEKKTEEAKVKAEADAAKAKADADKEAKEKPDADAAKAQAKAYADKAAKEKNDADAAKAQSEKESEEQAKKAREEYQRKAEAEIKNETTLSPIRKGEGYYQALERVHSDWSHEDVAKEAQRIKSDVYNGRTDLKVGEELRTVTPDQEKQLLKERMDKYDSDIKAKKEAEDRKNIEDNVEKILRAPILRDRVRLLHR